MRACRTAFAIEKRGKKEMRFRGKTRTLVHIALLAALALALGALESVFTPILPPGAKAGLSNVVVMYAASVLGLPAALSIVAVKALFALATRGAVAFGMSFFGGLFSALVLWCLLRVFSGRMGLFGISVTGAAVHNLSQGVFALFLFGKAILPYLPILLLLSVPCGLLSGAILGAVRYLIKKHSDRVRK